MSSTWTICCQPAAASAVATSLHPVLAVPLSLVEEEEEEEEERAAAGEEDPVAAATHAFSTEFEK